MFFVKLVCVQQTPTFIGLQAKHCFIRWTPYFGGSSGKVKRLKEANCVEKKLLPDFLPKILRRLLQSLYLELYLALQKNACTYYPPCHGTAAKPI